MSDEKRYVDLLIVNHGEKLYVVEADSGRIHTGGMVEIELETGRRVIGEVVDDAMFAVVGDEKYQWIEKLHTIYPVTRSWSLNGNW